MTRTLALLASLALASTASAQTVTTEKVEKAVGWDVLYQRTTDRQWSYFSSSPTHAGALRQADALKGQNAGIKDDRHKFARILIRGNDDKQPTLYMGKPPMLPSFNDAAVGPPGAAKPSAGDGGRVFIDENASPDTPAAKVENGAVLKLKANYDAAKEAKEKALAQGASADSPEAKAANALAEKYNAEAVAAAKSLGVAAAALPKVTAYNAESLKEAKDLQAGATKAYLAESVKTSLDDRKAKLDKETRELTKEWEGLTAEERANPYTPRVIDLRQRATRLTGQAAAYQLAVEEHRRATQEIQDRVKSPSGGTSESATLSNTVWQSNSGEGTRAPLADAFTFHEGGKVVRTYRYTYADNDPKLREVYKDTDYEYTWKIDADGSFVVSKNGEKYYWGKYTGSEKTLRLYREVRGGTAYTDYPRAK